MNKKINPCGTTIKDNNHKFAAFHFKSKHKKYENCSIIFDHHAGGFGKLQTTGSG